MINRVKINKEFFRKLHKQLDKKNEKVKTLDASERQDLIVTVKEYYQYLADNNISYGRLALEVVNNEGKYGLMANGHLKHQCVFDGIKAEEILVIRKQIIISLTYHDMRLRKSIKYNQNNDFCKSIEDYHISVFKSLATEYAWGGLAFRELIGSGSWLKLYEQGGGDLEAINLMFRNHKESKEYSSTRLMDSIKHTWHNYQGGLGIFKPHMRDVPFSPNLDAASKEYVAKLYNISEDRIIEIDAPKPETPMVAYKHYKILPVNDHSTNNYNLHPDIDLESLFAMMMFGEVMEKAQREIENRKKLAKLAAKIKTSLEEHEAAANKILKDFINTKVNNEENLVNNLNAQIAQIEASMETQNNNLFTQKQAECSAESEMKFASARANPGYSTVSTTVTISNSDIIERKQGEYHSLLEQYKTQCASQIAAIKVNYEAQANQRVQSIEPEIKNKSNLIEQQKETYAKELIAILKNA
ncbi:MAG TPA: hypothetical protein LFW21_07565 [Rickettsia endosymbiont of Pyrocoelia pectoralis]|nr:hypothetical protein [Rickettsia endosymbiont of Pyrocoelia pectoralis]